MEPNNTIYINRRQNHTQSRAALVDFCTGTGLGISPAMQISGMTLDESLAMPPITVVYHNESRLLDVWASRFLQLRRLKNGWNGYNAPAPSLIAITAAQYFTDLLLNESYEPGRMAPSVVGGVGVTQRRLDRIVYVEFYNDGRILALFSDDSIDSEPVIKRIEVGHANFKQLIQEMRAYLDA